MNNQIIGRLLPEWLNSNQHRSYPLDDSADGNGLPTSLFVDALFINSANVDNTRLYIKAVNIVGDNIHVSMGGYVDDAPTDFGVVCIIPFESPMGTNIPISIKEGTYKLAGTLVVGNTKDMERVPTDIILNEASGRIFPGCVRNDEDVLIGIRVNDVVYSGVVTLEAGDGIEFDVNTSEDGETTVKISCSEYRVPVENTVILSDEDILNSLMERLGPPVRTICGVGPDDNGDVTFSTPTTGNTSDQYVAAASAGRGAVALTIVNDTTDIKCTDRSQQIDSLAQNINILNERAAVIDESIVGLNTAQSNLSIQVARA